MYIYTKSVKIKIGMIKKEEERKRTEYKIEKNERNVRIDEKYFQLK